MSLIFNIVSTERNRHLILIFATVLMIAALGSLFLSDTNHLEQLPFFKGVVIPSLLIFSIVSRIISLSIIIFLGIRLKYKTPAIMIGYFIGVSTLNSLYELLHGDIGDTGLEEALLLATGGIFLITTTLILYPLLIEFMQTKDRLKSHNGLLLAMIENVPFDFWARDIDGIQIIQSNEGKKMWGVIKGQALPEQKIDQKTKDQWQQNNVKAFGGVTVRGERLYKSGPANESRYYYEVIAPYYIDQQIAGIMGVNIDITEQKEREFQVSVQSSALNAAANGIVITDVSGRIEWVNPAFETMTGYTLEEARGKNSGELVRSGYQSDQFYQDMWNTIISGKPWHGEMINKRKDGSTYMEEQTITPLFNAQREVIRFVGIKTDITERKEHEKKVTQSEQNFRSYLNAAPFGIFIANGEGMFDEVNPAALSMLGYTTRDLLGVRISEVIAEDSAEAARLHFFETMTAGKSDRELMMKRKDGTTFRARIVAVKLPDGRGLGFAEDVTERYRIAELARDHQQKLETLIGNLPGYIYRCEDSFNGEDHSRLLYVSNGVLKLTGFSPEELTGSHSREFFAHIMKEDLYNGWTATLEAIKQRKEFEIEYRFTTKNGEVRWLWERGRGIFDDLGRYQYTEGYVVDVTERKQAEERRITVENQLQAFYEQSSVGLIMTGLDTRFLKVNKKFSELTGYSESELVGMSYKEITAKADLNADDEPVRRLLAGEYGSFSTEKRYRRKDGVTIWVKISVSVIRDANNHPLHFATIVEDITQRRSIETAVQNLALHGSDTSDSNTFDVITKNYAEAMNADCAIVGVLSEDKLSIQTLAVHFDGKKIKNFSFKITAAPCERVVKEGVTYIRTGFREEFPGPISDVHEGMTSFLGTSLLNSRGGSIGLLVAMGRKPLDSFIQFRTIHALFAERTANELERLEMDAAIQKSTEEFQFLIEQSQDLVIRLERTGIITYCSPSIVQIGGYDPSAVVGTSFRSYFCRREQVIEAFQKMKSSVMQGLPSRYEFEFRKADGTGLWMESVGKAVVYQDGSMELQSILRDISVRKKSEEVLMQFKEIISATSDSISLVDEHFRYLVVNDAYLRRMSRNREEIEGHTIAEIFGEEIFDKTIRSNFERCLAGQDVHYQAWFNFPGEGRRFMDVQYSPYRNINGAGVLVSSRDITALKEAQDAKIESENRFKAVWENSHDAMRLTDADGTVVMMNEAYSTLMKMPMEKLHGVSFAQAYPGELQDDMLATYRERFRNRTVVEYFEKEITLWNHEILTVQASNKFLTLPNMEVLLLSVFKDVTKRVTAERELIASERRYRTIIESSMDGFWTYDHSGNILQVNDMYCAMSGYTKEELCSMKISDLEANEDPEETKEHVRRIVDNGMDKFESKHRAKNGTFFDVEISTVALPEMDVLVAFIGNITERKSAELALRESERRFRGILEDISLLSVILDTNGNIVMVNDYLLKVTQHAREDVLGKSWFELFLPEHIRNEIYEIFMNGQSLDDVPHPFENYILTRSGEMRYVRWTNITLYDNSNTIIGITSIGEDITDQKRTETALLEREEQYRTLITTMQQGVALHEIICSPEGKPVDYRFIDVNESFEQITGLKRKDLIGRTVLEVMPNTEQYWIENYGMVAQTGAPLYYENYSRELDMFFEVIAYRPKPNHFATIVSDITGRKKNERIVKESERQYRLLAENSTDVIWTMDLEGRFMYISPSVFRLRGFRPDEVMQQPLNEVICESSIEIVKRGLERAVSFASRGEDIPNEYVMIEQPRKDGTTVWTEVTTRLMYDEERKAFGIIGVTRDITERKRNEDLLRTRLLLSEFANDHSVKELLQQILDEAEAITESKIGFFHFVENDQKTIVLQTWSTNTIKHMCHADGESRHYSIDLAGVWVDCVHTKGPVIHNNYSELLHRKGLPEGHAPIHRELLIPIMRNEMVVGIMGVGNKSYEYDKKDVEIASQLATMAWDILERRRAELSLFGHKRALDGLSKAAVSLVHISEQDQQEIINEAISHLGTGLDADRVMIFRNDYVENGIAPITSLMYHWEKDPSTSIIEDPGAHHVSFAVVMPAMYNSLAAGNIFHGFVSEFSDAERDLLSRYGAQSIIALPIFIDDQFWGILALDTMLNKREWTIDERSVLRVAAESIGVAIHRMNGINKLFESEQMLKFALDATGDGIWTYTIPTNEVYFSPETKRLVGFEEVITEDSLGFWLEHVHPEDRDEAMQAMQNHLRGEAPIFINEHRFLCGDGRYRWMLDRGKVLRWNKDGSPLQIFGTYSDIHSRKETEQKIIELNEQLEEKVEDRTRQLKDSIQELESFSYSISHDLRAPVRAIDSFTKILGDEEEKQLSEEGKRLLKTIRNNTSRMGRMIDDLLQFSRTSRAEISKVHFDMNLIAAKVLEETIIGEKHRSISTVVHPLPAAYGDPSLVRQVLVNLISNSVKFTRNRETALIEIGGSVNGNECRYYVKDNGTGFDMKYADKLFGVFQRLHSQNEFEGTGVGLAIVHRVIQKHAGRIWVESAVDIGTTFTFTIPMENE